MISQTLNIVYLSGFKTVSLLRQKLVEGSMFVKGCFCTSERCFFPNFMILIQPPSQSDFPVQGFQSRAIVYNPCRPGEQ